MIISDRFRFVFIHIPKCAGTSVRRALQHFDDRQNFYFEQAVNDHEILGRLDYHHIPLKVLRDHFSEDFDCITKYASFAILREPKMRFPSSLAQRVLMYKGEILQNLSKDEIKREIDEVIRHLSRLSLQEPVIDPEFIHFSRQVDYIEIDGNQIVKKLYSMDRVRDLFSDIKSITGKKVIREGRDNERVKYKMGRLKTLDEKVQVAVKGVLPRSIWKPMFTITKNALLFTGLLERPQRRHSDLFGSRHVLDFVSSFYRDDLSAFARMKSNENRDIMDSNSLHTR